MHTKATYYLDVRVVHSDGHRGPTWTVEAQTRNECIALVERDSRVHLADDWEITDEGFATEED